MNIKQIEYVIAISKLGSFSAAAKAQFVTVQAVSKAVSDLENELGHALFIRESRGVHPTTFGSAFCVRAAGVVSELDVLKEFALNYDEENGALTQLRLALCTPAFGDNEMVRENIATFISHYLDIPTTMDLAMGSRGMEGLASRRFDALITVGTLKRPEVECDVLGTVPAGVMMRRGHDLAKKDRVSLDDLKPYPIALADWFDSANDTIVSIYQYLRAGLHFEEIGFNDVAAFLNRGGVFLTTGIPAMQRTHPDTAIRLFVPHDAIDVPLCIVYLVERREPLHAIAERMREASQQILNHGFLRSTAFTRRKALARPREFPPRNPTMKKSAPHARRAFCCAGKLPAQAVRPACAPAARSAYSWVFALNAFQMRAATIAPMSGATMNTQSWESAVGSPWIAMTTAGPKLRAGFTDVPVSGTPMMCTKASVRPMMMPANGAVRSSDVEPRTDRTKMQVSTISTTIAPAALRPTDDFSPKPSQPRPVVSTPPRVAWEMTKASSAAAQKAPMN